MAVLCGAVWPAARLFRHGLADSPTCALCGAAPDTIWHRTWECLADEVVKARAQVVSRRMIADARAAGPGNQAFRRALVPIPCADLAQPSPQFDEQVVLFDEDPAAMEQQLRPWQQAAARAMLSPHGGALMQGTICLDGSAMPHPVPDLRRAAWAIVESHPERGIGWTARGVVPVGVPQTAPAAEYTACLAFANYAAHDAVGVADCRAVVDHASLPERVALHGKRFYAGVVRRARARHGRQMQICKVKAHLASPEERALWPAHHVAGNDMADRLAKAAVGDHPPVASHVRRRIDDDVAAAEATCRVIAATTLLWPAARRGDPTQSVAERDRTLRTRVSNSSVEDGFDR